MREKVFQICCVVALTISVACVVRLAFSELNGTSALFCALATIGWGAVAWLSHQGDEIAKKLRQSREQIGLSPGPLDMAKNVSEFAKDFRRYHRAVTAFQGEQTGQAKELGESLRKIATLVYKELGANAVEMSLFDEVSRQWSQAMVIGAPRSVNSQAMLAAAAEARDRQILSFENYQVVVMPVMFAGKVFGALRVEIPGATRPKKSDIEMVHLYAVQGAFALLDASFTDELLRLRRASEETVQAKTGFLANLSHELRGPLGIILNGVELMHDGLCGPVSEQQQDTLKMVKESGEHLLDLVNDVLDYAKVEAGKIIPKVVQISVHSLLEDLTSVIRTQAVEKGHKLELTKVEKTLGMLCDKRHARQMLINFLTNAVKYTPQGGEITVSASRISGNKVKISVTDTGIGIPENQRNKVFSAFERVDDKYALTQIGTGLGMPLTLRLAEVNGGTANFESEVGKGSTFWIVLPAVEIEAHAEEVKDSDGVLMAQGNGDSILLIDHDSATRQMLGTYLEKQGFAIHQAKSGSEVFKILRDRQVELAVVESDMPDLPGEEMVAAIRSSPNASGVPIILLSSKAFVFDIERFLKLGVDRCLSKPVTLSEVATTARRLIDESRAI